MFDIDFNSKITSQDIPTNFPESIISTELLDSINRLNIDHSLKGIDRLVRAHGHTLREIFVLRHGMFKRIPDIILWPSKPLSTILV